MDEGRVAVINYMVSSICIFSPAKNNNSFKSVEDCVIK